MHGQMAAQHPYTHYKMSPKDFHLTLTRQKPKYTNPLYSQQSLTKYFRRTKPPAYTEPSEDLYGARRVIDDGLARVRKSGIQKVWKLQDLIRKSKESFNTKGMFKRIDLVLEYGDKAQQHFRALNLQDGINPVSQFSRDNFAIQHYIDQLKESTVMGPKSMRQKIAEGHKKAHAENIVECIHQEELQCRYRELPTRLRKADKTILVQSHQRKNRQLRSKTECCRVPYQPPRICTSSLQEEILTQSRFYMQKMHKSAKRGSKGRHRYEK